jgi:hypothetical protein
MSVLNEFRERLNQPVKPATPQHKGYVRVFTSDGRTPIYIGYKVLNVWECGCVTLIVLKPLPGQYNYLWLTNHDVLRVEQYEGRV